LLADAFKREATTNYGTAGPEFVRRMIALGVDKASHAARRTADDFVARYVPKGADGQVVRAGRRFGHIAATGELATELKITDWKMGAAMSAAAWAFEQ
jgi:putative DNA primase/helicase